MTNKLSHSALNKYQTCGVAYKYHYVDRLRERVTSGALILGSAIDAALNEVLLKTENDPIDVFEKKFRFARINNKEQYIPETDLVVYAEKDFDYDLLDEADIAQLENIKNQLGFPEDIKEVVTKASNLKKQYGWKNVVPKYKRMYSLANWLCLRQKGILMINAYKEQIAPKISKVYSVQEEISLETPEKDKIIGFVDLVADLDGVKTIIDNKTSSRDYDLDSASVSPQLILYSFALGVRDVAFIVLNKNVIKNKTKVCTVCGYKAAKGSTHRKCCNEVNGLRCNGEWLEKIDPRIKIDIVKAQIDQEKQELVLDNAAQINSLIKQGIFTRNLNSCKTSYGLCPYYNKCWNKKDDDLEQV